MYFVFGLRKNENQPKDARPKKHKLNFRLLFQMFLAVVPSALTIFLSFTFNFSAAKAIKLRLIFKANMISNCYFD